MKSLSIMPAPRLLAIVAFVYFAIAGATTHKFTQYHVAGDQKRLASFFAETDPLDILAFARASAR